MVVANPHSNSMPREAEGKIWNFTFRRTIRFDCYWYQRRTVYDAEVNAGYLMVPDRERLSAEGRSKRQNFGARGYQQPGTGI